MPDWAKVKEIPTRSLHAATVVLDALEQTGPGERLSYVLMARGIVDLRPIAKINKIAPLAGAGFPPWPADVVG